MAKEQKVEAAATTAKTAVVKKATTTTELTLGKSAIKLEAGIKALADASSELKDLVDQSVELTLKIAQQEGELEALKNNFAEELRSGKVELQNALKEDARTLVTKVLNDNGMEAVDSQDYKALKEAYEALKRDFNKEKEAAIGAALGAKQKEFEAAKALYESNAKANEADTKAKVTTLEDKVDFLEQQNQSLLAQLKEAGDNAVKIAQASSVGTINLGTDSKR
jgi:hypothetical protein